VLDPEQSHPTAHVQHTCTQGDLTSQSSVAYDIDLTQQSPSVCSQIISQHLEQHRGSGTQKRKRKQEYSAAARESPGDPTLVGTPLGGLKRRKLPAQDRGRGRRKRGGSRMVAVNQSPYIKRRSQRIRKRTPLVQHVDSEESSHLRMLPLISNLLQKQKATVLHVAQPTTRSVLGVQDSSHLLA